MGVAHVGLVHRDPCKCKVKGSLRFPPLRGMYQKGGTCKGWDIRAVVLIVSILYYALTTDPLDLQ